MVALESKADSFGSSCGQKSQGKIGGDDDRRKWAGVGATEKPIITPLFKRDVLLEQRIDMRQITIHK